MFTSKTFGVYGSDINTSGESIVAYVWADTPGVFKAGSFEGNASANGPYIELGFRPAIILFKDSDSNSTNWTIFDDERSPHNFAGDQLYPNLNNQEADGTLSTHAILDFLSNGFKIRGSHNSFNASRTIIYYAWAEAPSVDLFGGGANAR